MKKNYLFILAILLLTACSDKQVTSENQSNMYSEIVAEELKVDSSDFNYPGFQNKLGQMIFWSDEGLRIYASWQKGIMGTTTDIDLLLEEESAEPDTLHEKIYENAEIKTDGLKYYIKLNNDLTLEFEKVGHRIIKDSQGVEYYSQRYPGK